MTRRRRSGHRANPWITRVAVPASMTVAILVLSEIVPKTIGALYWQHFVTFTVHSLRLLTLGLAALRLAEPIHHPPPEARHDPADPDAHRFRGDGGARRPGGCVRGGGKRDDRSSDPLPECSGRRCDDPPHGRRGGIGGSEHRRVLQRRQKPAGFRGYPSTTNPRTTSRAMRCGRTCSSPWSRDVARSGSRPCAARSWP